jgi:hypothetical protein
MIQAPTVAALMISPEPKAVPNRHPPAIDSTAPPGTESAIAVA